MKKLLVSVLAAGLVFPSATALAKETAVPASAPTQPEVILHLDGNTEVKTPAKETTNELIHKATGDQTKGGAALTQPEVILHLDGNTEVVPTTTAKTTVATTTAPTTTKTTTTKPGVTKAVAAAKAKASSKAKAGAKALPKTSAVK